MRWSAAAGCSNGPVARVVCATDVHPYWWLGAVPADAGLAAETVTTIGEVAKAHAEDVTTAAADTLRASGFDVAVSVREGPAAEAIVAEAERWQADLIVVGTRGHGLLKRLLLGSTARSVMHHATASVLVTRSIPVRESRREHARATDVPTPRPGEVGARLRPYGGAEPGDDSPIYAWIASSVTRRGWIRQ